jgi:RNA polymerase sigma-70 factor, ECF subfamily
MTLSLARAGRLGDIPGTMPSGMRPQEDLIDRADGELAQRISVADPGGAPAEEAELCRRFAPRVRQYGLRHLRGEHAASDLMQRVLLLMIEKLRAGAVREPERISSFVLGTARRVAQEMRRGRERAVGIDPQPFELHSLLGESALALPSSDYLDAERLARCLEQLSERERTVIVLTYYQAQSAAEIAAALALQEGNVRVLRHRAIERLRRCLGGQEDHA